MGWPQITYIILISMSVGMNLLIHGKPKTGKHNFGYTVASLAIVLPLLWFGGFFS